MLIRCSQSLVLVPLAGCVFDAERRPTSDVGMRLASAHVFRGQTMTGNPVFQPSLATGLPDRGGGTTTLRAFGNLDLTDHTGPAWFDRGHTGEFTQIDLSVAHTRRLFGADATLGAVHYTWANNETFPFGAFPNTGEVFAQIAGEVGPTRPSLAVHRDVDAADGLYVRGELAVPVPLARNLRVTATAFMAWSDADHGVWLYRTDVAGLADAGLEVRLACDLDAVTSVHVTAAGSTVIDDSYREWFAPRVDADVAWFGVELQWRF
jgi:hypothetical protein